MFVIIGIVVVFGAVMGGYIMHGGSVPVLLQYNEFIIIGGAAIGSLMVGSPLPVLSKIGGSVGAVFKGDPYNKSQYMNLLLTLYSLSNVARRNGLISLESHVEDPEKSDIFAQNQFLVNHHHALHYFCDTLRMILSGGVPPHELEMLLDADIESHHKEAGAVTAQVTKMGDALPGLGIVAAVLGIVITMKAIDGPPAEIGNKVAAALVGTFLGILLSYGLVQPIAGHIELLNTSEGSYFETIKTGILAIAKGYPPQIAVEFARRVVPGSARPSFHDMEGAMKDSRSGK